jgi:hypothetical protein
MGEIYGALEWLQLPGLTHQDVVQFMRNAGSETMQLSYKEFVALLVPENADQDADVEESQLLVKNVLIKTRSNPFQRVA